MKLSDGVEWALHCCTVLALVPPEYALPAAKLAEFHGVPAAYLAKHLQALARAGIVVSLPGAKGGYKLSRPATEITLLDVVLAVEGTSPAFRCTEIRQRGPASLPAKEYGLPCSITRAMGRAEQAWRESLRSETIADLLTALSHDVNPRAAMKAATWMQEALA